MHCHDPDWWLPLSSYRLMVRAFCEARIAEGHTITFRGLRRYYRMGRDGTMFIEGPVLKNPPKLFNIQST